MTVESAPSVPRAGLRGALLSWVPTIVLNIVLPIVTYSVLTDRGVGEVPALLISGVWPVLETVLSLAIRRKIDEFSIFVLIFLGLGVVAALGFNSPRLLLIKESVVTGLFGVVLLGSLLAPRPLMFYFGRRFATNGTPESIDWWNGLWQYPNFRRTQRVITIVWGVAMCAEALLRIVLAYQLSTDAMVVVSNVLPYVVLVGLITWTITYGKRQARAAQAARAAVA
ncbi:VC0807 family protein [Dactylosporangium cerinum]|uniref:VC0807 family protein n=1 Tax=Dactylosporangium cerinum TaxID=1434730 RepID=A0ABV9VP05_9ACTN